MILKDAKAAKLQTEKFERQEQLLTLTEGFEKIKCAINVSDMEVLNAISHTIRDINICIYYELLVILLLH